MSERAKTSSSCVVPSTSGDKSRSERRLPVPLTTPHKLCPLRICTCADATINPTKRLPPPLFAKNHTWPP